LSGILKIDIVNSNLIFTPVII